MSDFDNIDPPNNLDYAIALCEAGFSIIPLGDKWSKPPQHHIDKHNGKLDEAVESWPKTPRIKWKQYQEEPAPREVIEKWWGFWPSANIGICTGVSDVVIIDADSELADEFIRQNLTFTPYQITTSKGAHYYFRFPGENIQLTNSAHAASRIDVRGVGGYVVAEGSVHYSGHKYARRTFPGAEWDGLVADLPRLTDKDVRMLNKYRKEQEVEAEVREYSQAVFHGQIDELYLKLEEVDISDVDMGPAVEGERNVRATKIAGSLFGQGMPTDKVREELQRWNDTNSPPLPVEELETIIGSIEGAEIRKLRSKLAQANSEINQYRVQGASLAPMPDAMIGNIPVDAAGRVVPGVAQRMLVAPNEERLPIYSALELESNPPPLPETFWHEKVLFRGSRVLLAGAPKLGKSNFALGLMVAGATHGIFLGHRFSRPVKCLWLQAEIHPAFLRERVTRFTKRLDDHRRELLGSNLYVSGRIFLDLLNYQDISLAASEIERIRPDVLCIDPIINFSTVNENSNTDVHKLLTMVDKLAGHYNCATIVVHHTGKHKGKPSFDNVRGAGAFRGWYDTGIMLSGEAGDSSPTVSYELRNAANTFLAHTAQFDDTTGLWIRGVPVDLDAEEERGKRKSRDEWMQIIKGDLLDNHPHGIGSVAIKDWIMERGNVDARQARNIMKYLDEDPDIISRRSGGTDSRGNRLYLFGLKKYADTFFPSSN